MNRETMEAIRTVRDLAKEQNFNWNSILDSLPKTLDNIKDKEPDEITMICAYGIKLSLLISNVSIFKLPQKKLNAILDVWEACIIFGQETRCILTPFYAMLHLCTTEVAPNEIHETLESYLLEEKERLLQCFELSEGNLKKFTEFCDFIRERFKSSLTEKKFLEAEIVWLVCAKSEIYPDGCTNIVTYCLQQQINQNP